MVLRAVSAVPGAAQVGAPGVPRLSCPKSAGGTDYAGDMFTQTQRYADLVREIAESNDFDVIHAHDWMTYRAGMVAAQVSGRPLGGARPLHRVRSQRGARQSAGLRHRARGDACRR